MKNEKNNPRIGGVETVQFVKNKKGGKPICYINGIVGFLSNSYRGEFVQENSEWQIEIDKISRNCVEVIPLFKTRTPFQMQKEMDEKLSKLSSMQSPKKEKHKKVQPNFPYLRESDRSESYKKKMR